MKGKLMARGNVGVQLFNRDGDTMIRFEWVKRNPFHSFSYDEFMDISNELIDLSREYQSKELEAKILAYANEYDYLEASSLSGGQDDNSHNKILAKRGSYSPEEFSSEIYKASTNPQLTLRTPNEKGSFMLALAAPLKHTAMPRILPTPLTHLLMPSISFNGKSGDPYFVNYTSNNKRRLEFYGQSLKPELFAKIVDQYHKPGLSHSLNHDYIDNPLSYFLCKVSPI
jgi:hypothetical protein